MIQEMQGMLGADCWEMTKDGDVRFWKGDLSVTVEEPEWDADANQALWKRDYLAGKLKPEPLAGSAA